MGGRGERLQIINICTLPYGSKYTSTTKLYDYYYYLAGGREVRGRANNFKTSSFCKILMLLWIKVIGFWGVK